MEKILIEQIAVETIIGVYDQERTQKQPLLIDIELRYDATQACQSDNIQHALDYHAICVDVHDFVSHSKFQLLEALAHAIAMRLLKNATVFSVRVNISKPQALERAKTVHFELLRFQAK